MYKVSVPVFMLAMALIVVATSYFLRPASVSKKAADLQVAIPTLNLTEQNGERSFNTNCATCHGVNAAGESNLGPSFINKIYEPSHHGDHAFVIAARNGVRAHHWSFGNMPPVPSVSDNDLVEIIAYVRAIQKANGIY